jgi:pyridoxamine 5'-phosphate oxidase
MDEKLIVSNLRQEYHLNNLDIESVNNNPINQFVVWMNDAINSTIKEPNAMVLATSMIDFKPSARVVLLKGVDESGFTFFTNYDSRKGKELLWNPYASLVFMWLELERQVRIEGRVDRISEFESEEYFKTRPRESQLGAIASPQSKVIESRMWLDNNLNKIENSLTGLEIKKPVNWGGYIVVPNIIEFWQGRPNRMHDRIQYTRIENNNWRIERLAP